MCSLVVKQKVSNRICVGFLMSEVNCPENGNAPCLAAPEEMVNGSTSHSGSMDQTATVSKRQLKRLAKREKWLEKRKGLRKIENATRKRRKMEKKSAGFDVGPSRSELKNAVKMTESPCKVTVCVDMAFDDLMTEKDMRMAIKQLQSCYSINRRAAAPLQFYIANFCSKSRSIFDSIQGNQNWDVHLSESDNVLTSLEPDKIYIIGGLVDHNAHKGLCHKLAVENGLAHAKLPIAENLTMKSRHVLTINHVFEILLKFTETNDWSTALLSVIPKRKLNGNLNRESLAENDVGTAEQQPVVKDSAEAVGVAVENVCSNTI